MRRILGIDPGLRVTGYGILVEHNGRLLYVASGCIRASGDSLPTRLGVIARDIAHVIAEERPTEVAVERVFVNVNPNSTLLLGQARGAALCAAVTAGLPVREYTPLQIKQAVVGYGKADKIQVQKMVQRLLALERTPGPDAADALACAICAAHAGGGALRQRPAGGAPRGARGGRARAAWSEFAARAAPPKEGA